VAIVRTLGTVSGNTIHPIAAGHLTEIEAPQTVLEVPRGVILCRTVNELPKETLVAREETLAAPIVLVALGIEVVLVIAAELETEVELVIAVVLVIAEAPAIAVVWVIAIPQAIAVVSATAAVASAIVAELRIGVE